jgi:hypothetical protein
MEKIIGRFLTPLNPSRTHGPSADVTTNRAGKCRMSLGTARKKISLEQGRLVLAEDMTGKGHITRAVGSEDWVSAHVSLADQ